MYYLLAIGIFAGLYFLTDKTSLSLLLAYSFLVLAQTVLSRHGTAEAAAEWRPLWFLTGKSESGWGMDTGQIAANMVMFLPIGFLLSHLLKRPLFSIPIAAVYSMLLEGSQYLLHRGLCETDDVIHNTVGAAIGCLLYLICRRIKKKCKASQIPAFQNLVGIIRNKLAELRHILKMRSNMKQHQKK